MLQSRLVYAIRKSWSGAPVECNRLMSNSIHARKDMVLESVLDVCLILCGTAGDRDDDGRS